MIDILGQPVRLVPDDGEGRRPPRALPDGWPVLEGTLVAAIPGPFAGVDGAWPWYVMALTTALPAGFDPLHWLPNPLREPLRYLLVQPQASLDWRGGATPADPIGAALAQGVIASVGVYVGMDPQHRPASIQLADIRAQRVLALCAGRLTSRVSS